MSFFATLLADVDRKADERKRTPQPSRPQPQKRKRTASAITEGPVAKTKEIDRPWERTSTYFAQPLEIQRDRLDKQCRQGDSTPHHYAHGPRSNHQNGPLIGYKTHAAILRAKLASVVAEIERLGAEHDQAFSAKRRAKGELERHVRDQRRSLRVEGEKGMSVWQLRRDVHARGLDWAERRMQRVRARKLPVVEENEEWTSGAGVGGQAESGEDAEESSRA